MLTRWAHVSARHTRAVILTWLLAVVVLGGFVPRFLDVVQSVSYHLPGSESARTSDAFATHAGFVERDVLVTSGADAEAKLAQAAQQLEEDDRVTVLPLARGTGATTTDGRTAYTTVLLNRNAGDKQKLVEHLQEELDATKTGAALTGTSPVLADMIRVEESDLAMGELLGIPVALVVLFFACGALVAAFIPILTATLGLVACLGLLGVLSYATDWGAFIESIVAMLGLGLGIDYTLLVIRRFREERTRTQDQAAAIATTLNTAGRTVAFSGLTVMVSLPSFLLLGEPLFRQMAIAGMLVVLLMVALAIGFVPAVLLALGDRVDTLKAPRRTTTDDTTRWGRWARRVMARPWLYLLGTLVLLGLAASPSTGATLGVDYGVRALQDEPSGRALTQLQAAFPHQALAPVDVAITGGTAASRATTAARATEALRKDDRIDTVATLPDTTGAAILLVAEANVPVDAPGSPALVEDLRARLHAIGDATKTDIRVGGTAAEARDYSERMSDRAPAVILVTLALSFLLLTWVFRSLVIPVKAIICNLLSVGAAYGLLVLVFQHGHGEDLLGFTSPGYLQSWMPLTLFVFIFGLSMDYEVFLVTRMREEWLRSGDNQDAVAHGLDRTGGVVSSAATIMVAVFAAFMVTATVPEIKQFAFGLGAAVVIDATIVRAVLVPAAMRLAGRWNWWLPRGVDRLLPGTPGH